MPLLLCPNDNSSMQTVDRAGVQFDMCPTCRGVWLDRGELEKLMAAGAQDYSAPPPPGVQARPTPPPQPFSGGYPALLIIAMILAARVKSGRSLSAMSKDPALWLAALGWLLVFKVFRFWLDWGLPDLALWTALQLQELLETNMNL